MHEVYEGISILSFGLGFFGIVIGLGLSMGEEEGNLKLSRIITILGIVAVAIGVGLSIFAR